MIEGVTPEKPNSAPVKVNVELEDTKMSISHLLTKGYAQGLVKDGIITAVFRSLTTEQVHETDSAVVAMFGVQEHRAAKNSRYIKYLSKSLIKAEVDVEGKTTTWDFSELKASEKEEALKDMSSFVFNRLFALYMKFEDDVSKLLDKVDLKKS